MFCNGFHCLFITLRTSDPFEGTNWNFYISLFLILEGFIPLYMTVLAYREVNFLIMYHKAEELVNNPDCLLHLHGKELISENGLHIPMSEIKKIIETDSILVIFFKKDAAAFQYPIGFLRISDRTSQFLEKLHKEFGVKVIMAYH